MTFLQTFKEAQQSVEETHVCHDCGSSTMVSSPGLGCVKCTGMTSDDTESIMPAVAEVMMEIPADDEGEVEHSSLQKLMRIHRNLGHSPNRLLSQILKEAKAPASIIDIAS